MRIKEFERTANVAWSPFDHHPTYLAAGTAAQQLDATFSTNAEMEIFHLNFADSDLEMPKVASVTSDCRFHKVLWSPLGCGGYESGLIVAGTDHGNIMGWDAGRMLKGEDCLIFRHDKHTGAVKAMHFSPHQPNLLSTGAGESEIYIWDLNTNNQPMMPGAKSQPLEELSAIAWNNQVQHILGSAFSSRCVVWDLRKSEPIIKISDSMSRIKCNQMEWHPDVATQLCLSSEDDHTPFIQLWDLRFATSPLKTFENHRQGVLSIAWCPKDSDLLLSCGKDNRILCWNVSSNLQGGEVVCELPTVGQWCFDVQWCPRNPNVISCASVDGRVNVYSLMGGGHPLKPSDRITESFSNVDSFSTPVAQVPHPVAQVPHEEKSVGTLKRAPRWLKKPVGASFSFGGKLVTFGLMKPPSGQLPAPREIYISQVVTEVELVEKSELLERALLNNNLSDFCALKIELSKNSLEDSIWRFMKVNFESDPRTQFVKLLGYDQDVLSKEVRAHTKSATPLKGIDAGVLTEKMLNLSANSSNVLASGFLGSGHGSPRINSKTSSRDDLSDASSAFDEIAQGQEANNQDLPFCIPDKNDKEGLFTEALLTGNFEAAVEMCIHDNNMAEAILIAIASGPELLATTQKRFFDKTRTRTSKLLSYILNRDWQSVVSSCNLSNWKEALAVILTYSTKDDLAVLCDNLGQRMESELGGMYSPYATLCYICSGNLELLVENWIHSNYNNNNCLSLQDLIEKVMVLMRAVEHIQGQPLNFMSKAVSDKLSDYASLLASQGSLETALSYLGSSTDHNLTLLQDRLNKALRKGTMHSNAPFPEVEVQNVTSVKPAQYQLDSSRSFSQPGFQRSYQPTATSKVDPWSGVRPANVVPSVYQHNKPNLNIGYTDPVPAAPQPRHTAPVRQRYPNLPVQVPVYDQFGYGVSPYPPLQPQPIQPQPLQQPQSFYNSVASQPLSLYNPADHVTQQVSQYSQLPADHMQAFQDHKPAKAWNDPPPMREKKLSGQQDAPQQPITQPLFGVPTDNPAHAPYPNLYNPQMHQPVVPQYPVEPTKQPAAPVIRAPAPRPTPIAQAAAPVIRAPAPQPTPIAQAEIPSEHQVLQYIFDSLLTLCLDKATNPQMKRKLDDVTRKLTLLYDKLRDNSLSSQTVLGLHQIVLAIQQLDYSTALAVHTQIVGQGNFSEIGGFMPGLKILLQSAVQLQVYVQ